MLGIRMSRGRFEGVRGGKGMTMSCGGFVEAQLPFFLCSQCIGRQELVILNEEKAILNTPGEDIHRGINTVLEIG